MKTLSLSLSLTALALSSSLAGADTPSGVWRQPDGTVIEQSASQRSVGGLGAMVLVTPDADWAEKWNTPSDVVPSFTTATEVKRGGKVVILTFVANPQPDRDNNLKVHCDLKVTRPDASVSTDTRDVPCLEGPLQGAPANVRLSSLIAGFTADPGDQAGQWTVAVRVKDLNRGISVLVTTAFTLVEP